MYNKIIDCYAVVKLSVAKNFMLNVVMLAVVMLSVVAPENGKKLG